jgi:hypothetical protein
MSNIEETIHKFFTQYGWEYENIGESTWVTGFQGEYNLYYIYVRVTEDWILLSISPFVPRPAEAQKAAVYSRLMRANFEMTSVKFCIDDNDDVVLAVELTRRNLPYAAFETALDALSYYADIYYPMLLKMV